MRTLLALLFIIGLSNLSMAQDRLSTGDTIYFDFNKEEGEAFRYVMASRLLSKVAGSAVGQLDPFYSYGIVAGSESDRKGRTWTNIKVYYCFKYPHPEFSTVRIYDIESAISSGEIKSINDVDGFYDFFFLKEDQDKAKNLITELIASDQDIERNRNILRTMIDRSYDYRYNHVKELGYIY